MFRTTRQGGVGAGEVGQEFRAEDTGIEGRDAEFSKSMVDADSGDVAGLSVEAVWGLCSNSTRSDMLVVE